MDEYIRITPDGPEDSMTDEKADVHIARVFGGTPGTVTSVVIETERGDDVHDTMMALDYGDTHRAWDPGINAWTAHLDPLNELVGHFQERDVTVTVAIRVAQAFEESRGGRVFLPDAR